MAQHRVGVDETPTIIYDGPNLTKEQTLDSETSSNTKAEAVPPLEDVANGTDRSWTLEKPGTYDKVEITENDYYDELGSSFPSLEKWMIWRFTVLRPGRWVEVLMLVTSIHHVIFHPARTRSILL